MRHVETHLVMTVADAELAVQAGLPATHLSEHTCAGCGNGVGYMENAVKFTPLGIVMDHQDLWYLCMRCLKPLTHPQF